VRQLSGLLAGGLVALALVVCAAQGVASASGRPGPGMPTVAGHLTAALAAVTLQLAAERLRGRPATLASAAVLTLVGAVLWFGWWA
jgi:hypothetical protein